LVKLGKLEHDADVTGLFMLRSLVETACGGDSDIFEKLGIEDLKKFKRCTDYFPVASGIPANLMENEIKHTDVNHSLVYEMPCAKRSTFRRNASGIVSRESNRCQRRHKPVVAIESKRRVEFHCPVLCCQFGGRSRSVCSAKHLSSVSIYAGYLSRKHRRNEP
jgi:hypothetical protein